MRIVNAKSACGRREGDGMGKAQNGELKALIMFTFLSLVVATGVCLTLSTELILYIHNI